MSPPETLAAFVARGWDQHAEQASSIAADLLRHAPGLVDEAASADAVALAEHVWVAHLGDAAGLLGFLQALPAATAKGANCAAAVQRTRWVLALLEGAEPPAIAPAPRWRAMQNLWTAWAHRGHAAQAQAMLQHELPLALAQPDLAARRALAAACNNLAADLRSGPRGDACGDARGDAQRDALMLDAAHASQQLWASAGTWVNAERADYQLARCHAAVGYGAQALQHAQACLATIDAHADEPQADAFERFFAHEALAWAQRAAGDGAATTRERAHMTAKLGAVNDPELRRWCEQACADFDAAR